MTLTEAIKKCVIEGCFVTNTYFSEDQSMHYWNGNLYYEDGAIVQDDWLFEQNFAKGDSWSVCAEGNRVNKEKLASMHSKGRGYMLPADRSYMECIIA